MITCQNIKSKLNSICYKGLRAHRLILDATILHKSYIFCTNNRLMIMDRKNLGLPGSRMQTLLLLMLVYHHTVISEADDHGWLNAIKNYAADPKNGIYRIKFYIYGNVGKSSSDVNFIIRQLSYVIPVNITHIPINIAKNKSLQCFDPNVGGSLAILIDCRNDKKNYPSLMRLRIYDFMFGVWLGSPFWKAIIISFSEKAMHKAYFHDIHKVIGWKDRHTMKLNVFEIIGNEKYPLLSGNKNVKVLARQYDGFANVYDTQTNPDKNYKLFHLEMHPNFNNYVATVFIRTNHDFHLVLTLSKYFNFWYLLEKYIQGVTSFSMDTEIMLVQKSNLQNTYSHAVTLSMKTLSFTVPVTYKTVEEYDTLTIVEGPANIVLIFGAFYVTAIILQFSTEYWHGFNILSCIMGSCFAVMPVRLPEKILFVTGYIIAVMYVGNYCSGMANYMTETEVPVSMETVDQLFQSNLTIYADRMYIEQYKRMYPAYNFVNDVHISNNVNYCLKEFLFTYNDNISCALAEDQINTLKHRQYLLKEKPRIFSLVTDGSMTNHMAHFFHKQSPFFNIFVIPLRRCYEIGLYDMQDTKGTIVKYVKLHKRQRIVSNNDDFNVEKFYFTNITFFLYFAAGMWSIAIIMLLSELYCAPAPPENVRRINECWVENIRANKNTVHRVGPPSNFENLPTLSTHYDEIFRKHVQPHVNRLNAINSRV